MINGKQNNSFSIEISETILLYEKHVLRLI